MEKSESETAQDQNRQGPQAVEPWWKRISGTFANDPMYREAMDLGRQFREEDGAQKAVEKH